MTTWYVDFHTAFEAVLWHSCNCSQLYHLWNAWPFLVALLWCIWWFELAFPQIIYLLFNWLLKHWHKVCKVKQISFKWLHINLWCWLLSYLLFCSIIIFMYWFLLSSSTGTSIFILVLNCRFFSALWTYFVWVSITELIAGSKLMIICITPRWVGCWLKLYLMV